MGNDIMEYHSSGKLLLTAEYLVLHGSTALTVPTKPGQSLQVDQNPSKSRLTWETRVLGKPWFSMTLDTGDMSLVETSREEIATRLTAILLEASVMKGSSGWLEGKKVLTRIEFDIDWGLGSSSSLISNIAYWAGLDPFILFKRVDSGSAYDIAAARAGGPLLYTLEEGKPGYRPASFDPPFIDQIGFAWLGRKQDSAGSVRSFLNNALVKQADIDRVSMLSQRFLSAGDIAALEEIMEEHEQLIGSILDRIPVKQALFPDYPGAIKSLGAWGGDFILVTMPSGLQETRKYFSRKGMEVLFPYTELIKSQGHEQ